MAAIDIIRVNNGVGEAASDFTFHISFILMWSFLVCAEQLAPVLNPQHIEKVEETQVVNESWMLDTVLKLEGVPIVTEDGDIIYGKNPTTCITIYRL